MKPFVQSLLFLVLLSLISSCRKDELPITSIPIKQLTKSYVELADNTIEIPEDLKSRYIINQTENSITFNTNSVTDKIVEGGYIISSWDTPAEDFIIREVVSLTKDASQIVVQTTSSTMLKAYKGFHINSDFEEIVSISRSQFPNLSWATEGVENTLNAIVKTSIKSYFPDVNKRPILKFGLGFEGEVNITMTHPNTVYNIWNLWENGDDLEIDISTGMYEEVKEYFKDVIKMDYNLGVYSITVKDFSIGDWNTTFGYGVEVKSSDKENENLKKLGAQEVFKKYMKPGKKSKSPENDTQEQKFINKFLGSIGPIFINFIGAPIFSFKANAAVLIGFNFNYPEKINIATGNFKAYLDLMLSPYGPVVLPKVERYDGEMIFYQGDDISNEVPLDQLFNNWSFSSTLGVKGECTTTVGVALGVGASVGVPELAEVLVGGGVIAGAKLVLSGEGAIVLNGLAIEDADVDGMICLDLKAGFDPVIFTKLGTNQYIYEIKTDSWWSLFSGNEHYVENKGLCYPSGDDCSPISVNTFSLDIDENEIKLDLQMDYKASAPSFNDPTEYEITLGSIPNTIKINGLIKFNTLSSHTIPLSEDFKEELLSDDFEIEIYVPSKECRISLNPNVVEFNEACIGSFKNLPIIDTDVERTNIVGETISYLTYNEAKALFELSSHGIIETQLTLFCSNPTGWMIGDGNGGYTFSDSDKSYIWIEELSNEHNILVVNYESVNGVVTPSFYTQKASSSYLATLLN